MIHEMYIDSGTSRLAELLKEEVLQRRGGQKELQKQFSEMTLRITLLEQRFSDLQSGQEPPPEPVVEESSPDELKQQLCEELRKAEVEMAVERAKVFQERAALEEMRIKIQHDRNMEAAANDLQPQSRLKRHVELARQRS